MIDVINSGEDSTRRNIQLIIETHSEHFLRRLQRRIAEDDSLQSKVSAYFADITKSPAKLEPLDIDLEGNITNWPKDFFGDMMGDVIAHDEKALEKRIAKCGGGN
jgi:predicted ATPase